MMMGVKVAGTCDSKPVVDLGMSYAYNNLLCSCVGYNLFKRADIAMFYKLDKKTKTIATVVAIIALLIGGVCSYDFNPVSEEQQQAAISAVTGDVFWSPFGKVYHTHDDCQALNQSDTLTYGTVEQAIAANRTRLCSFCAKNDNITGVVTDGAAGGE